MTSMVLMTSRSSEQSPSRTPIPREIWVLVSAALVIALGYGMVAPILPQFAKSFDVSIAAASAVVSAFAGMRLLFAPAAGRLLNAFGSRTVYLSGLLTVAVSTGLVATAHDYWHVLVLRAAGGIGSTMFTVSAMGLIVRIAPPSIRGKASSTYATAFLLGNILGPLLGSALAGLGMRVPFIIYGIALLIATALVWIMLDPAVIRDVEQHGASAMRLREAWGRTCYRAALVGAFYNGWANYGVRVAIIPLYVATFHSAALTGMILASFAAGNAVALQGAGRLADTLGRKPLALTGIVTNATFTAVLGLSQHTAVLIGVSVLAGAGAGILAPAQQATVADVIGQERSGGGVLATFQMVQDLGTISGPLIIGMVAEAFGFRWAFALCAAIGLVAVAAWAPAEEPLGLGQSRPQPA